MVAELRVTASVVIRRPLVEVFDKVCDVDNAKDWLPFCERSRMIQPSSASDGHRGIGPGMTAVFDFAYGPIRVQVLQEITGFEWGRSLKYSTTGTTSHEGDAANPLARLIAPLTPRTSARFDFEPMQNGTVLTVEVLAWITSFGGVDIGRPVAADALFQTLSRLKRIIEQSDPLQFRPWIFFNYRRTDADFASDRAYDTLRREFGEGAIFRDVFHMRAGAELHGELRTVVGDTRAFLAIIGPTWLHELNRRSVAKGGGASPATPTPSEVDWVTEELSIALDSEKTTVIPILMGNTVMPAAGELPASIAGLATRSALRLRRDPDFERDSEALKRTLWGILRNASVPRPASDAFA